MTNEQRRQYSRIAFRGTAEGVVDGRPIACTVRDLSLKGALIELTGKVAIDGETAELVLRLDDDAATIRMRGRIAHREAQRVGLEWERIDLDSMTHLRRLLELNLGDPSLLDRELSAMIAGQ